MSMWNKYKESSLVLKMTSGLLLGIIVGIIFGKQATKFEPLGTLFIHLLSLVAIPVIFLTVILAANIMNVTKLGRMGGKLVLYYAITTGAAVLFRVVSHHA